ncbi:MAG: hypothetical protein ABUT20_55695 [Bacteroidota bacterium]
MAPLIFSILITIAVELIVISFFYKRKGRQYAVLIAFILNIFTWPIVHMLIYTTSIDVYLLMAGATIVEAFGYWLFLRCNFFKGCIMSVVANALSYSIILFIFKTV